jgi:ABC-type amino acid transport substrate-binding protein
MVKNGTTGITSIDDIVNQSKKIVVNTGTTSELWVQENLVNKGRISADNVKSLATIANCVQDVISGKSDVFIIDKPTVDDYVKTSNEAVIDVGTIDAFEPYGVAFNKNAGDLKAIADEVIQNMMDNGEMAALWAYWDL